MKKKFLCLLLAGAMALSLTACGGNEVKKDGKSADMEQGSKVTDDNMTLEELVKAAQEEAAAKDAGVFRVYSPTSRVEKALNAFAEEYGIKGDYYNESGQDLYTKLTTELEAESTDTADVALLQDSYLFQTQLKNYDYVVNYVPPYIKDSIKEEDREPLVCYYYNKLFIYNNKDNPKEITNVWQLTDSEYKGKIFMKDISKESVNKNFLAGLTSPEFSDKLAKAYKEHYGKDIALDENCKNAGYQFIKSFLPNVSFGSGDGDIATELSDGNGGNVGLIVYSKLRDDSVKQENLTVAAYQEKQPDCFSGFMYPMYLQMIKNTDRPYTAKLFIYFLMTEKGFKSAFQTKAADIGTYSANTTISPLEGDKDLDFWKKCLVKEDTNYLSEAYADGILDFITYSTSRQ